MFQPKNGPIIQTNQGKKMLIFSCCQLDRLTPSCQFMGHNSKSHHSKKLAIFHICQKNKKNQHLTALEMANQ